MWRGSLVIPHPFVDIVVSMASRIPWLVEGGARLVFWFTPTWVECLFIWSYVAPESCSRYLLLSVYCILSMCMWGYSQRSATRWLCLLILYWCWSAHSSQAYCSLLLSLFGLYPLLRSRVSKNQSTFGLHPWSKGALTRSFPSLGCLVYCWYKG